MDWKKLGVFLSELWEFEIRKSSVDSLVYVFVENVHIILLTENLCDYDLL